MAHAWPWPGSQETLAWESRYVGDVRVINAGLLDAYLLKSLDGAPSAGLEVKVLSIFKCGRGTAAKDIDLTTVGPVPDHFAADYHPRTTCAVFLCGGRAHRLLVGACNLMV